jgi:hypothetical protein
VARFLEAATRDIKSPIPRERQAAHFAGARIGQSLNVSVTAGILLHALAQLGEARRRRVPKP